MNEKPYDSETLLQDLLDKYPNLLAAVQTNNRQRHWLLVKRSLTAVNEDLEGQQWSLERLFLDQQAIPTFVDVRYSNDDRTRKDRLGQMLDCAANAVLSWPVESILAQFEANCRSANRDPEQVFEEFLGSNADEEQFWQQVKTNLQAGKVRLIFVSDSVTAELQRVVEFLNKQMDPAEVLAVEIKQYISDDGMKTLASNVIGQTAEALYKKSSTARERRQWNDRSFLSEYEARYGEDEATFVQEIYQWAIDYAPLIQTYWATGDSYGGFAVKFKAQKKAAELFFVGIDGTLQIVSDVYANLPPFDSENEWYELIAKMSSIGLALPTNPMERRLPNFQISTVADDSTREQVLSTFDWVVDKLKGTHPHS
nr:hypothetical protein [Oscillatoria sp. FACHB-1406]